MEPGSEPRPVRQGRPGVIVAIAFVVELVAIGSLANQVVNKHLVSYAKDRPFSFPGRLVQALTTYQWRVGSQPGDRANEPIAHVCLDLVVLALTALLVWVLCRGAITFFRAFFATWLAVVVATLIGMVVFALISPPSYPRNYSHLQGAIFLVPDGFGFVAGIVLGFVTAVFAAIFAVATRRTIRMVPANAALPSERPSDRPYPPEGEDWPDRTATLPREEYAGYYGNQVGGNQYGGNQYGGNQYGGGQYGGGPYGGGPYGGSQYGGGPASGAPVGAPPPYQPGRGGEETERLPDAGESAAQTQQIGALGPAGSPEQRGDASPGEDHPTAALPRAQVAEQAPAEPAAEQAPAEQAPAAPSEQPAAGGEPTQQFPRPPDDEDLGQHPDHHDL